jgi:hypothetical protein
MEQEQNGDNQDDVDVAFDKPEPSKKSKSSSMENLKDFDVFAHMRGIANSKQEHDTRLNAAYIAVTEVLVFIYLFFAYFIFFYFIFGLMFLCAERERS